MNRRLCILTAALALLLAPAHLAGELLKREAGVDMIHVPYRGAAAAAVAVLADDVDMMQSHSV
jgi:tripartite-type tricarboxylate transporter receptor subunit TctC